MAEAGHERDRFLAKDEVGKASCSAAAAAAYAARSRIALQWLSTLAGSSGGLAVGASVGLTSVLIPGLQAERDPAIRLDLEQGSWLGELETCARGKGDQVPCPQPSTFC